MWDGAGQKPDCVLAEKGGAVGDLRQTGVHEGVHVGARDFSPRLGADALELPRVADLVHRCRAVGKAAAQVAFEFLQGSRVVHE